MVLRKARTIVFLVSLAGCSSSTAECLQDDPNNDRCCIAGHADHGFCCPFGMHAVRDVEHPDWRSCFWDEDAGADANGCADAGADRL
jgi:hypothetical protein